MNAYATEIAAASAARSLDPVLVTALVEQESGVTIEDTYAYNPEEKYHYLWNVRTNAPFRAVTAVELASLYPPHDFPTLAGDADQEWWAQRASWGLMQIMGAVAREGGFKGPFLVQLSDPVINLGIGCTHLAGLLKWSGGNLPKALGAYNAGRGGWNSTAGQAYAAQVMARMK